MKYFLIYIIFIINIFGKTIKLGVSEEVFKLPQFIQLKILVEKSFSVIGYKTKLLPLPNSRAINSASNGETDGSFPYLRVKLLRTKTYFLLMKV